MGLMGLMGVLGVLGVLGVWRLWRFLSMVPMVPIGPIRPIRPIFLSASSSAATTSRVLAGCCRLVFWSFAQSFWQRVLLNVLLQKALDISEVAHIGFRHEGDGDTIALGTSRSTDAVYIVLGIVGNVIVDDHEDVVDVDAS